MNTLTNRILRLAPQYQPDAEDLRWIEAELDRVADKALPKLVRKRFVETLRSAGRASRTQTATPVGETTTPVPSTNASASATSK
ncbi:MAG: hypothetical protein BWY57_01948 [Betaproteobacteria bacterium ADurb.Bin341]|nr:MAG: hypothetical protein BWY57_01948 [Betaproteobacteria bacterium ADurb.Bin341]HOY53390.1 hypothetical protein [Opitutaceae bacterium]